MSWQRVVVVGGGAAGVFGAIACATCHGHTEVTLLEAGVQLLSKVRISGGGRCNVTHDYFDPATLVQNYPRGGKALRGPFTRFQPRDTVNWFASHGVQLKTEADGRMFPVTDDSQTIVDCLLQGAIAAGVNMRTGATVVSVSRQPDGFVVGLKSGERLEADRLLLATGSNPRGYQLAAANGHKIIPPVPSLFTFKISDPRSADGPKNRIEGLAGVSVENVRVQLPIAKLAQTGPLLITHWGLSGPAILKLSAWGARVLHECGYQTSLIVNWLPQYQQEQLRKMLLQVKSQLPKRALASSCPLPLPRRLWQQLVYNVGISEQDRWAGLSNKLLHELVLELNRGTYQITGKGVFKEEFVTCGGVSLQEVNFQTMESRRCRGLYFAGEILDIDGVTGGFNFQSAWTTGWLAGQAMGM
ncbi:MAG: NAD(P)/FAD-dependent oxidoreductase [Hormoscilla sp. GM102CHS1]|nr:NAD(P)/FAD-dependent oxidoreductase [Hormoscilla sp. GM102CHS1]